MVLKSVSLAIGLPHSGHSGGVSGKESSSMVLSTSPNGSEIIKTVGLVLALAVEIPAPALVRAAPDMRDGVNKAAIDQRQPVGGKRRRHRHAVGAVAIKQ